MDLKKDSISKSIYIAIDKLKTRFGGIDVKLLSDEMYRTEPDEFCEIGYLGVDIEIEGIKTFLGCSSMAEIIAYEPYGSLVADEFIYTVLKPNMKKMKSSIKTKSKAVERKIKNRIKK